MFDFFWKSETENIDMKTPERRAGFKLAMEKKISSNQRNQSEPRQSSQSTSGTTGR